MVSGGGDIGVYKVDPVTRQLVDVTARTINPTHGAWGVCLYRSNVSGLFYAFAQAVNNGMVEQFELFDNGLGKIDARPVRGPWDIHPEPVKVEDGEIEACVVDDVTGDYYVAEQDVGVWRYGAEPTASSLQRTLVLSTYLVNDGALVPDVEGLAVIHDDFGSFLLASSQGDSSFGLYRLDPLTVPYPLIRKFRVTGGAYADGCSITDGLDATSLWLGPAVPPRPVRLPGQHEHRSGHGLDPELQVRAPGGGHPRDQPLPHVAMRRLRACRRRRRRTGPGGSRALRRPTR